MELTYRALTARPPEWGTRKEPRQASRFEASWSDTLQLLDKELWHLGATEAFLQVELSDPLRGVRIDGQLRADARATHPGVILTIATRDYGTLVYPCDEFVRGSRSKGDDWQQNVRAIALGLQHLRTLDRYGIAARGQQYAGFRELGAGTAVEGTTMNDADVARFLATSAGLDPDSIDPRDGQAVRAAYREAARRHHPDAGGNPTMMAYINAARDHLLPEG